MRDQLVPVPRTPNVDTILDEWLKYLQNEEDDKRRYANDPNPVSSLHQTYPIRWRTDSPPK